MIMYQTVFPPMKKPPKGADALTLLECGRYIEKLAPGFFAYLPLGMKVINRIEEQVREAAQSFGFLEVSTPVLQDQKLWQDSGRFEHYGDSIYSFDQDEKSYVVSPTSEELMVKLGVNHQDAQPLSFFQIGERVRDEPRPAFGLVRAKSFILADFYIVCHSEIQAKYELQRACMVTKRALEKIGVEFRTAFYAKKYAVSYWQHSDKEKQCIVYLCEKDREYSWRDKDLASCPRCGDFVYPINAIELADATVQQNGDTFLATAGIGVSRLLQVLAKNNKTDTGINWPRRLAPFQIEIVSSLDRRDESTELYHWLQKQGLEVLLDMRDQHMGRKFIDADLFGAPARLIYGKQTTAGKIEVKDFETQESKVLSREEVMKWVETKSFHRR